MAMSMFFNCLGLGDNKKTIIWSWCNEYGSLTPYEPLVSNKIEEMFQTGTQSMNLGIVEPTLSNYQLDLANMKQIRLASGKQRIINRLLLFNDHVLAKGIIWEFQAENIWTSYDIDISNHLEIAYQQNASLLDLQHFGQPYKIDFQQWIQIRSNSGTQRKIRRRALSHQYQTENFTSQLSVQSQGGIQKQKKHVSRAHPYNTLQVATGSSNLLNSLTPASSVHKRTTVYRQVSKPFLTDTSKKEAVTESLPTVQKITLDTLGATPFLRSGLEVLGRYMIGVTQNIDKNDCAICCDKLNEPSSYGDNMSGSSDVVELCFCKHQFHKLCLLTMYNSVHKGNSLQCPCCNTIYGEKTGTCPPGTMEWYIDKDLHLAGYEDYSTICISYHMSPGIQGPEHPHPGQRYKARGFPRTAFLPDCNQGRKVLKLLIEAFGRRLTFTIGTSTTTGEQNTLTWNEIHHKTESYGNAFGHGYPDPKYLDNVLMELASHGVVE
ncbi:E3 ubiquitin-protein ligase DTX4-like isoform X2 [Biomphalaria glabrata]|nr:E3 ubiquitin-protein ligase DTX4-like isoform X2 [Biomphalaria glabrata]